MKVFHLFSITILLFSAKGFSQDTATKRLYLGNDTHLDLMYNGTEEKWSQLLTEMADFYLKLGEDSKNEEPAKRSKWNYDCAYWLYVLEKNTTPEYFQRIIAQIKNQQASVPYNFTLPVYGASTAESILRSFYYGGYVQRKYGIDVELAVCQENATIPLGLGSLWAGSGAKYSWKGVCNCATKTKTVGIRNHEIFWYKGLDSSRILMKWYSSFGWNAELGGYAEMLEPTVAVIQMDTLCGSKRYPYHVAGAFGKGWDNMVNYAFDVQWGIHQRTRPGTKLFISNELDFFRDFEKEHGHQIDDETQAYGNEWDLLPATLMNVSSGIRRSMEKLRSAEAMAAIIASKDKNAFQQLDQLKKDFLYGISTISAHGWTTDGPITKDQFAQWARKQQHNIALYVDSLFNMSATILGNKIENNGNQQFFVFNPLNWIRTDFADYEYYGDENISVRDESIRQIVPHQWINKMGKKYLRVLAKNIPSVGYKTFTVQKNSNKKFTDYISIDQQTIETPYYKIKLTKAGVITSLVDKKTGTEYAKNTYGRFLNDIGSGADDVDGTMTIEQQGAVSATIFCKASKPIKHSCRITVYNYSPRIDIDNEVQQNFNNPIYWSFSFNSNQPEIWHEETGAIIKAAYKKNGGHYADERSRVDHLTFNHFADVSEKNKGGIMLSNADCLFMKLGESEPQKLDNTSGQINVLIGGQIDKDFKLGIVNQGGDSLFKQHFSLQTHGAIFDATTAMKFSLEHQNPMVTGIVAGIGKNLLSTTYSFLQTNNPAVIAWSIKPAEENDGIITRWWNMSEKNIRVNIKANQIITDASICSHVETILKKIAVTGKQVAVTLNNNQIKTFKLKFIAIK
jgi:alpha-mannosidase